VILCTGGGGKVFPYTTNANIKTGDGMALAYRAGVPLKDMEFVQYHPTGLPFTGILITEAARAEGGWLLNKDGYRYLQDYDLGSPSPTPVKRSMELGPRDRLSQAFVKELEKGRTVETPTGTWCTWTSATWAPRSSTRRSPSCGSSVSSTRRSTRCTS
jgi:fumarate reductase flavoprotein subunit